MTRIITKLQETSVNRLDQLSRPFGVGSWKLVNGTEGISDIEGKAATGSGERAGEASEFQISVFAHS